MHKSQWPALLIGTCLLASSAAASISNVGFEEVRVSNGDETPLTVGIWYPTKAHPSQRSLECFTQNVAFDAPAAGRHLSLVVLSHGGGGSYASHYDTALALAHAGFVAAALSHAGDTYDDQTKVMQLWRRPVQLQRLISYMLHDWPQRDLIDARHIGAFGFSNGGFTVLVAAGGVPDLGKIGPYCQAHSDHDLCQDLKQAGIDPGNPGVTVPPNSWRADSRIKAIAVAAPAFGFAFGRAGLQAIHIPIQLWRAADDRHQPNPEYEEAIRLASPQAPEYHVIPAAGHYDFLPPCSVRLAEHNAQICAAADGFDRAKFHNEFNADIVRFFRANLH